MNFLERLAYNILSWHDVENLTLRRAVANFAKTIPVDARVLDAGAGLKPYEDLFQHCRYESCDFPAADDFYGNLEEPRRKNITEKHTFVCSLEKIPAPDCTYDAIVCTQVLEHVPDPLAVLIELHRLLKPSGRLLLTVPQGWGIHGEPYHFFHFTKYGLDLVLQKAGFEHRLIFERGGYFLYLYDRLALAVPRLVVERKRSRLALMLLLSPIHIFLAYVLGPLLLLLEPFDREKRFTLGYVSTSMKPAQIS